MTDEEAGRVRDFVGYGRHQPDPKWPGGADQPRVWITCRIDIARHWQKVHPRS